MAVSWRLTLILGLSTWRFTVLLALPQPYEATLGLQVCQGRIIPGGSQWNDTNCHVLTARSTRWTAQSYRPPDCRRQWRRVPWKLQGGCLRIFEDGQTCGWG